MPFKPTPRTTPHAPRIRGPIEMRFWPKVERRGPDECWPWLGAIVPGGYGRFGIRDNKVRQAHRIAYELTVGPVPDGLLLRHSCDNPNCVNPAHLIPGTAAENADDRRLRNRHWRTITPEQVAGIKQAIGTMKPKKIAAIFGVRHQDVLDIKSGKSRRNG